MNVNLDDRKIDFTSYQGPVVLDTGLYIEFFGQTELGKFVKKNFIENDSINPILLHDLLLTEIYYITCRQLGAEKANEVLEVVKNIGTKIPTDQLVEISGQIKCTRSLSLSDCFGLGIGKLNQIPTIFKSEGELIKENEKEEFDFPLYLLE